MQYHPGVFREKKKKKIQATAPRDLTRTEKLEKLSLSTAI